MIEIKVLVIEDDKSINNFLKILIKTNNYQYINAENGINGISLFMTNNPDIILLDLGLPDIDGMEVLTHIRNTSDIPIIVISARGQEKEKVMALDLGADDYITKPFNVGELLARMRVALRHHKPREINHFFALDNLKIDFLKRKVYVSNNEIHLTPIEYKMLVLLVENCGKVVTHKFIQQQVWGYDSTDEYQSLRVFMANIRRKIEDDTSKPRYIITEVGVGYRFVDE
jgi:two-component system KDP operon response regulator KdpE